MPFQTVGSVIPGTSPQFFTGNFTTSPAVYRFSAVNTLSVSQIYFIWLALNGQGGREYIDRITVFPGAGGLLFLQRNTAPYNTAGAGYQLGISSPPVQDKVVGIRLDRWV